MPATKGNQFWKQRSKHGRDKLFESSTKLWNAACEYFSWCDENPWMKVEQLKKPMVVEDNEGNEIVESLAHLPTARPYSLGALCLYLNCNPAFFRQFKKSLKKSDKDFSTVISRIEDIISTQQWEGATVGAYNSNIISRTLGLADNQNIKHDGIPEAPAAKQVMIFNGQKIEF